MDYELLICSYRVHEAWFIHLGFLNFEYYAHKCQKKYGQPAQIWYVGNIHTQVTEPLLQEVFASTSPVESCKLIRKDKSSYGFIHNFDRRFAALTIVSLNERHLFGQPIKVNWAYVTGQREDTSGHYNIFVGDLSPERILKSKVIVMPLRIIHSTQPFMLATLAVKCVIIFNYFMQTGGLKYNTTNVSLTQQTTDEMREYFLSYGEIVEHQIMLDHVTSRSRGFGFVTFDSEEVFFVASDELG
ncbi:unnamed protein product [Lactuca virosa]|uniref:RRM domain-containing protein n=1 Tax=Lactuca virosa TaxID=75947 RepID=A0AAU9LJE5_9ASTR|nr:unnamed protein product [Lactuca virosa]